MKTAAVVALVIAALVGLLVFWAVGPQPDQPPPEQVQTDVQPTRPSPVATAAKDVESGIRSKLKSSIGSATDRVLRRTKREATARASDWRTRMERLITSLDTLRTTVPNDAGVGIYVSPQRDLVEITLQASNERSVRLRATPEGDGYDVEPLGDSIVESGHFASLPRLLLWVTNLIGDHVGELRAARSRGT